MTESLAKAPTPLVIYGAGGMGREAYWLVTVANAMEQRFHFLGFADDTVASSQRQYGFPVDRLEGLTSFQTVPPHVYVAVGRPAARKAMVSHAQACGLPAATLVHPSAVIGLATVIGEGSLVAAQCMLTCDVHVGRHVLINHRCTIGHDVQLGDYATILPCAILCGGVDIGTGAFVGAGAMIRQGLRVGAGAVVGMGAVVTEDVPAGETWVGVPARFLRGGDRRFAAIATRHRTSRSRRWRRRAVVRLFDDGQGWCERSTAITTA